MRNRRSLIAWHLNVQMRSWLIHEYRDYLRGYLGFTEKVADLLVRLAAREFVLFRRNSTESLWI